HPRFGGIAGAGRAFYGDDVSGRHADERKSRAAAGVVLGRERCYVGIWLCAWNGDLPPIWHLHRLLDGSRVLCRLPGFDRRASLEPCAYSRDACCHRGWCDGVCLSPREERGRPRWGCAVVGGQETPINDLLRRSAGMGSPECEAETRPVGPT